MLTNLCLIALLAAPASSACDTHTDAATVVLDSLGVAPRELPPCASRIMRAIHGATAPYVQESAVPEDLFVTWENEADPIPLIEGPAIFGAKEDEIAAAEHEVLYQTFVWEPNAEPTQKLLRGLKRLEQRRKVEAPGAPPLRVSILIDASDTGLYMSPFPVGEQLARRGIAALNLDPDVVHVEVASYPHLLTGNLHSKVLIVDGRVGIVAGANPEDVHASGSPWYDLGFRVRGRVGAALRAEFLDAWNRAIQWTCPDWTFEPKSCTRPTFPVPDLALPGDHYDDWLGACSPMLIVGRPADENPFATGNDNTQNQAYLAGVENAEQVIRIQTPNLNDPTYTGAILDAIEAGTPARVLLPRGFNFYAISLPTAGGPNENTVRDLYDDLAARGVENPCEMLQLRWFSRDGVSVIHGNGPGAAHAKYASFDGQVAIVGSTNGDQQSWYRSREVDIVVDDSGAVAGWDGAFEEKFAKGILPEECGGPVPLFRQPSLLELVMMLSPTGPRPEGPGVGFFETSIQKHVRRWHFGFRVERLFARADVDLDQDDRDDTITDLAIGAGTAYDLTHSGRTSLFAHFWYENDRLHRMQTRRRLTSGFRHQAAPWSSARLTLDVGGGWTDVNPVLGPGASGLHVYGGSRLGWMILPNLALQQEISAALGALSYGEATLKLGTVLSEDLHMSLSATLLYDRFRRGYDSWDLEEGWSPPAAYFANPGFSVTPMGRLLFRWRL